MKEYNRICIVQQHDVYQTVNTRAEGLQIDKIFPIPEVYMVSCSCKDGVSTQVTRGTKK